MASKGSDLESPVGAWLGWTWLGPAPWPAWEGPGSELVASGRNAVLEEVVGAGAVHASVDSWAGAVTLTHVVWAPGKSRTSREEAGG